MSFASILQLSILVKGARGAGKSSLIRSTADELGYNVVTVRFSPVLQHQRSNQYVQVDCWDIIGDTPAHTEGAILAAIDKTSSCSPSILLLHNIEALAKRSEAGGTGRSPGIVKVLDDALISLREASGKKQWPCIMVGTTSNVDDLPGEVLGSFKQKIELSVRRWLLSRQTWLTFSRHQTKLSGWRSLAKRCVTTTLRQMSLHPQSLCSLPRCKLQTSLHS